MITEILELISHYIYQIFYSPAWKSIISVVIATILFIFPGNEFTNLMIVLSMIILDTITGIMAALKQGSPIKSGRLFGMAIKICVYFMILVAGKLVDIVLGIDFIGISIEKFLQAWLMLVEFISILENSQIIGVQLPSKLLHFLRWKINDLNIQVEKRMEKKSSRSKNPNKKSLNYKIK